MSGAGGFIKDTVGSDSFLGKDEWLGGNSGQVAKTVLGGVGGAATNSVQRMGSKARTQANEAAAAAEAEARRNMPKSIEMPYIDPTKIAKNKARRFANLQRRSGRQSTLLTNQSNTFG